MFSLATVTATGPLGLPEYDKRSKQTYMSLLRKAARALAPEGGSVAPTKFQLTVGW